MNTAYFHRYIGDRAFYRRVLAVALPILLQNLVTNFVSLLDNLMVGQTGTASMSGVAVAGQLFFIFYLVIFGMVSGPGIFCAQFWGAKDERAFKTAFRFKLFAALALCLLGLGVCILWGRPLCSLYLTGKETDRQAVLGFAEEYLRIMLWGMVPYTLSMVYASTLRETGRTFAPMVASWTAVGVNLVLNWVLIFGKLGAPALGVRGAAIATVISRLVEMGVNMGWSHSRRDEVLFTRRMLEGFPSDGRSISALAKKSVPLMLNESLWAFGSATLIQIYSTRGLEVVAAMNIAYVLLDLFNFVSFSIGTTIGILVGQELGAGEPDRARDTDRKLLTLGVFLAACIGGVMLAASGLFPRLYNTTPAIRALAAQLIRVLALVLPFDTFAAGCYFTMRSGGKTFVTFLFDSVFSWVVNVPVAYALAHWTALPILPVYALSSFTVLGKCVIGAVMVRRGYWINRLSAGEADALL